MIHKMMNPDRKSNRSYPIGLEFALLTFVVAVFIGTAGQVIAATLPHRVEIPRGRWASFRSAGFSVQYPVDWVRKGISKDHLRILSSEGGVDGVVIKGGQAMISVFEVQKHKTSSLQQLVDLYEEGTTVLVRKHIRNKAAGTNGCRDLYQVIAKEPVVPPGSTPRLPPDFVRTEFFCRIGHAKYVTILTNFEGDERQTIYQEAALRVAESLHARPRAETSSVSPR